MRVFEISPDKPLTAEDERIVANAKNKWTTFLVGTIETENSEDWRKKYVEEMKDIANNITDCKNIEENYNSETDVIVIYNPKRNTPTEDIDTQINWELDALENVDNIYVNFEKDSKSPISLLELGLFARTEKICVTCPKEFYKYDNVRVVCERYNIPIRNEKKDKFNRIK